MIKFVTVSKTTDIPVGEGRVIQINGQEIALFNVEGNFHAIDNVCTHRGGPLGEGLLNGTTVTCPWHAWTVDVTTGKCKIHASGGVKKYKARIRKDNVEIAI